MTPEYLRPDHAAAHFGVHKRTLARWAAGGLIGRSKVGRITHYPTSDIAELLEGHTTRRRVIPMPATETSPPAADWRSDEFWSTATPPPCDGHTKKREVIS